MSQDAVIGTKSYKKRCNLVVYGYIKHMMHGNKSLLIPDEINQLIVMFYLLDIESEMVWDKQSITKAGLFKLVNDHKIRLFKPMTACSFGSSAKLKYGISAKSDDYYPNIQFITWKIKITATKSYPTSFYWCC